MLGVLKKGKFRIIDSNKEFTCTQASLEGGKVLSEDFIQATKNEEVIATSDASCKAEHVARVWII